MCCGKMVRLPGERERKILTTGDISIDLDKENREKKGGETDNLLPQRMQTGSFHPLFYKGEKR